jgi:hypothetical protein
MFSFSKKLFKTTFTQSQKRTHNTVLVQHIKSLPVYFLFFLTKKKLEHEEENTASTAAADYYKAVPFETTGTGLEPSLNWSLSPLHIHPQYEAFGNASLKNILKSTYGELDSKKQNLTVQAFPIPNYQKYALKQEKKYEFEKDVQDFSEVFAKRLLKEVIFILIFYFKGWLSHEYSSTFFCSRFKCWFFSRRFM